MRTPSFFKGQHFRPMLLYCAGPAAHGTNGKGGGVEMAFDPMMKQAPSSRRLGGNEYAALNEESEYVGSEGEEVQHARGGAQDGEFGARGWAGWLGWHLFKHVQQKAGQGVCAQLCHQDAQR